MTGVASGSGRFESGSGSGSASGDIGDRGPSELAAPNDSMYHQLSFLHFIRILVLLLYSSWSGKVGTC